MWFSGVEQHPGTGVFPGRGLGKGHRPALAEAAALPGFQRSPGRSSSKSQSQSRARVCVC